jgi:hypothetical protein
MAELPGDAVVLFDPYDEKEIRNAIDAVTSRASTGPRRLPASNLAATLLDVLAKMS